MITIIAKKEFMEIVRDGRFSWLSAVLLVLLSLALLIGWQHAEQNHKDHEAALLADRNTWLNQGHKNPHVAAHFSTYAFKPTPFLSYVDRGMTSYLGTSIWLEAHYQNPAGSRPAEDGNALQRFGELTAAWTLQYLVPLFIIILAFSAFAGERERGTLRQLKSLELKARDLAIGKVLGVTSAFAILLVPVLLIAVAVLVIGTESGDLAAAAPRMIAMVLIYLLYFTAFLSTTIAVSAQMKTARLALLTMLAFWIGSSLLLPRLAAEVAEHVFPTPTSTEFIKNVNTDIAKGLDGHSSSGKRVEALRDSILQKYNVKTVEELPVNFVGIRLQAGEDYSNLVYGKHYDKLWKIFANQERVQLFASLLSPTMATRSLSMGFAGTDLYQHRHFTEAAEKHRRIIIKQLNEDMIQNAGNQDLEYLANPALWEKVPRFEYQAPSFGEVLSHYALQLSILIIWCLAAFFLMLHFGYRIRII